MIKEKKIEKSNNNNTINEKKNDDKVPDQVLFGLILLTINGPLKFFPII